MLRWPVTAVLVVGLLTGAALWWRMRRSSPSADQTAEDSAAGPAPEPAPLVRPPQKRVRASLLLGQTIGPTLIIDGLVDSGSAAEPPPPRRPFSLIVRRPGSALADAVLIRFIEDWCHDTHDVEVVVDGSSRQVVLCGPDMEIALDLAEPVRFR